MEAMSITAVLEDCVDQLAVSVCEALLYLCICSNEMRLESVEAMSITAVLEDCVDQLAVSVCEAL